MAKSRIFGPIRRALARQRGATLLEAMLGILIFSIGILALVGMQALAIRQVTDAKYRADASFLANEIIGEMWVNRANLASYAYGGTGSPPSELANWVTRVQSSLPGITATVNQPTVAVAGTTVTVTIFWQPPGSPTVHNHVTVAHING
jgi:type IV pilus assembly protein PilV